MIDNNDLGLSLAANMLNQEADMNFKDSDNIEIVSHTFGQATHGKIKIEKAIYAIKLTDILNIYIKNRAIRERMFIERKSSENLQSFFDGSFYQNSLIKSKHTIYLAIYADEINMVNPIGI